MSFALLVGNPTTVLPDLHRNARLRSPPSLSPSASSSRWPLLVFSHGLGGGKHVYSQLSRYWASRGYVVLVLQHADGSGPATIVRNYATGEETDLPYIRNEELSWTAPAEETVGETKLVDVEPPAGTSYDDKIPLRRAQLEIRHAEVYEAFDAFKAIVCGEATEKMLLEEGLAASNWEGNVDVDSIYLGGHRCGRPLSSAFTREPVLTLSAPLSSALAALPRSTSYQTRRQKTCRGFLSGRSSCSIRGSTRCRRQTTQSSPRRTCRPLSSSIAKASLFGPTTLNGSSGSSANGAAMASRDRAGERPSSDPTTRASPTFRYSSLRCRACHSPPSRRRRPSRS